MKAVVAVILGTYISVVANAADSRSEIDPYFILHEPVIEEIKDLESDEAYADSAEILNHLPGPHQVTPAPTPGQPVPTPPVAPAPSKPIGNCLPSERTPVGVFSSEIDEPAKNSQRVFSHDDPKNENQVQPTPPGHYTPGNGPGITPTRPVPPVGGTSPTPPMLPPGTPSPGPSAPGPSAPTGGLHEVTVILDQIINIGEKVWKIVVAGKPVVTHEDRSASAVPSGTECWIDLEQWSMPKRKTYKVTFTNLYGIEVVQFKYAVDYIYGGSVGGIGKYLANVTVSPASLKVIWGYTFHADVAVPTVVNMGTRENPVAGMQIRVGWQVVTPVNHNEGSHSIFVTGEGDINRIDLEEDMNIIL